MGGIGLVPLMIGMFAISEILRYAVDTNPQAMIVDQPIGNVFKGMWRLTVKYPMQILRGSALGTLVGALPGAGADIAAWMSYAVSKKFSKEPEKFGTGHVEGIVESGPPTTARWQVRGSRRWCSAFPATRSRRS
jgi:TctA family transporter